MFFATVTVSSEAYGRALTASGAQGARSPSEPGTESAVPSSSGSSSVRSAGALIDFALPSRAAFFAGLAGLSTSRPPRPPAPGFLPGSRSFRLLLRKRLGGNSGQSRCCVLDLGSRITVDFLPFSCYPPPRSRPGSGTVKYPPAASTTRTARSYSNPFEKWL